MSVILVNTLVIIVTKIVNIVWCLKWALYNTDQKQYKLILTINCNHQMGIENHSKCY